MGARNKDKHIKFNLFYQNSNYLLFIEFLRVHPFLNEVSIFPILYKTWGVSCLIDRGGRIGLNALWISAMFVYIKKELYKHTCLAWLATTRCNDYLSLTYPGQ